MAKIESSLLPNEDILMEGSANMQQVFGVTKGGKLVLTNKRILFFAHAFNFGSKFDEFSLSEVATTGNAFNIFTPTPNMIKIELKNKKNLQFVVSGKQKDEWKNKIFSAMNAYMESNRYLSNLDEGISYCSSCGNKLPVNSTFCSSCGKKLT